MAHYQAIIAYDGSAFRGFQRQAAGLRTVQAELEAALRKLGWGDASLLAAGRTDTGVHARGQVVSFCLEWGHSEQELAGALNSTLPGDLAVRSVAVAPEGFHPRYSALRRHYRYSILVSPERDPLEERFAWRIWPQPHLELMGSAAGLLIGRHDFRAFGRSPSDGGHTRREVFRADWGQQGSRLRFDIEAEAYLYRMVRRLVAAMLAVGRERLSLAMFADLIDDSSMRWEQGIAPAQGLCLEAVIYPGGKR